MWRRDRISQSAREVTARISDLVWATNPRNDSLENLAVYLREQVGRQLDNTRMAGQLAFPDEVHPTQVSATFRRNVALVVREAVNNALKHSAATSIAVELQIEVETLYLRVSDNGRGFDPAKRAGKGNGLANMARRIRELSGHLDVKSQPEVGTSIEFRIPLKSDANHMNSGRHMKGGGSVAQDEQDGEAN